MSIDTSIRAQESARIRIFQLIVGALGIIYFAAMLIWPDLELGNNYFVWIALLPGFIEAVFYGLAEKPCLKLIFVSRKSMLTIQ